MKYLMKFSVTPASFEPSTDYVVTKIPRFAFEKFSGAQNTYLAMKSVGEVMSIARTFEQSFQKALRSLETGLNGFDEIYVDQEDRKILFCPNYLHSPKRIYMLLKRSEKIELNQIYESCKIDHWFLKYKK